jgi:hypothetical protein
MPGTALISQKNGFLRISEVEIPGFGCAGMRTHACTPKSGPLSREILESQKNIRKFSSVK